MKLVIALALVSVPAFAGGSGKGLSFDELKEACQNPAKFQNQIAPSNLQITCEEHLTKWEPTQAKGLQLPCSRYIAASVTSDKYTVNPDQHAMNIDQYSASCPTFKEMLEVTTFTKATTCEEILALKGDEEDFCADILEKARQENPKIVQLSDTGRNVELCTQSKEDQGKGKGQGEGKSIRR